jgi:hypothetical protein
MGEYKVPGETNYGLSRKILLLRRYYALDSVVFTAVKLPGTLPETRSA